MKTIATIFFALFASVAQAGTFGVHLVSRHFPEMPYHNDVNPGVYYKHDNGATAGYFKNSFHKDSFYLGYTWEHGPVAVTVGGVTGYADKVKPMLVPSVALFTYQGMTPRLAYIPKGEKGKSHVLHLMLEF